MLLHLCQSDCYSLLKILHRLKSVKLCVSFTCVPFTWSVCTLKYPHSKRTLSRILKQMEKNPQWRGSLIRSFEFRAYRLTILLSSTIFLIASKTANWAPSRSSNRWLNLPAWKQGQRTFLSTSPYVFSLQNRLKASEFSGGFNGNEFYNLLTQIPSIIRSFIAMYVQERIKHLRL